MNLQFYAFITTVMLLIEYGKGLHGLQKHINGLEQTNNNKYLLMIVINPDERSKPISRTNYDVLTKKQKIQHMRVVKAHEMVMQEIIDFMKTHIKSTVYLLEEVQRIKRDHQIKDELREMVTYLEKPKHYKEKQLVLDFFNKTKRDDTNIKNNGIWNQIPNSAVINIIRDPFNDGVAN